MNFCRNCGRLFVPRQDRHSTCDPCKDPQTAERVCKGCGEWFKKSEMWRRRCARCRTPPSRVKVCSRCSGDFLPVKTSLRICEPCRTGMPRGMDVKSCLTCGGLFVTDNALDPYREHCSPQCESEAR